MNGRAWMRRAAPRPTAFRLGVLAGVVTLVIAWTIGSTWLAGPKPKFNIEVVSNGADVSRLGGRRIVVVAGKDMLLTQTCKGVCDDLWHRASSGGRNDYGVEVLDAAGRNLVGPDREYVDSSLRDVTRWTLAGREALQQHPETLKLRPDGSLARVVPPQ